MSAVVEVIEVGICERCNAMQDRADDSPHEWATEHNDQYHPDAGTR